MKHQALSRRSAGRWFSRATLFAAGLVTLFVTRPVWADPPPADQPAAETELFREQLQPLLAKYCIRCHNADNMKSGVRVDNLSGTPTDRQMFLWKGIQKQVGDEAMPPDDEPRLSADERQQFSRGIDRLLAAALARNRQKNGSIRRLTVAQYRNTLRDLLGLEEDLTEALPPDGVSKDGFVNHDKTLLLSPLQVESYFDIAAQAVELCLVDENTKPVIQNFRVDLGAGINPEPCPDQLILGANSDLLKNADFLVTELAPPKPFAYTPFAMRRSYQFIEGYAGNDTVRGWRTFDSIYHAVFACMRGTPGYPKGEAHQAVKNGLLLRPAIPSPEIFGRSNTYGPMANFKISLRELPNKGNFRITVKAARYPDALLLDKDAAPVATPDSITWPADQPADARPPRITLQTGGIYQVDVIREPGAAPGMFDLTLSDRQFAAQLVDAKPLPAATATDPPPEQASPLLVVRLPAGDWPIAVGHSDKFRIRRVAFTRLPDDGPPARQFAAFERRSPSLGVYLGLRRDCGSTLTQVRVPVRVESEEPKDYVFEGPINDYPSPDVEADNVNYLAGVREIGVRSEYTDGRDMPRLVIRSVEFEGPLYDAWPPATHRNIFIDSPHKANPPAYARDILQSFATKAFRRPVRAAELASLHSIWQQAYAETQDFRRAIKDALVAILTAPQFLFVIETSASPDPEPLDEYELAAKLAYFLWNTAPDRQLLQRAATGTLRDSLDQELDRLVAAPQFEQFTREFVSQWLSLDKFDVVAVDAERFPRLTRDAKSQLRQEPIQFVQHLIRRNLPLRNLLQSDFILANEVVANYYDLGARVESGFQFVPLQHDSPQLGGLLTQASILAGLSDGREANPVKRGAWLARKVIAEPPDDPPPNVPQIKADDGSQQTLRQKLERHRNQPGCAKCHAGIDPWGLPFEGYDAGGRFRSDRAIETRSKLPDGTDVADLNGLKSYLAEDKLDRVAFSFLKHAATYAVGRSLTYNELVFLQDEGVKFRPQEYRLLDLLRFVIKSDLFLQK